MIGATVVAFADKAAVVATADDLQRDKSRVKKAIDDIDLLEIGGGTQMALGMDAAIAEIEKKLLAHTVEPTLVVD